MAVVWRWLCGRGGDDDDNSGNGGGVGMSADGGCKQW